jgi:peptide/nickel transport system ATP-binding protein/oligopeptide transport system ATP-binding protein
MYGGLIVERGPSEEVFKDTRHPYTLGLLKSLPRHDQRAGHQRLLQIEGAPPDMRKLPQGCPFAARCTFKIPICDEVMPPLIPGPGSSPNHLKACHVDVRTGEQLSVVEGAAHV